MSHFDDSGPRLLFFAALSSPLWKDTRYQFMFWICVSLTEKWSYWAQWRHRCFTDRARVLDVEFDTDSTSSTQPATALSIHLSSYALTPACCPISRPNSSCHKNDRLRSDYDNSLCNGNTNRLKRRLHTVWPENSDQCPDRDTTKRWHWPSSPSAFAAIRATNTVQNGYDASNFATGFTSLRQRRS